MIFEKMRLSGAHIVRLEKHEDERGFFARAWCRREFAEAGLDADVVQANLSASRHRGTLRGLHYQLPPAAEAKLVRCTRGAIFAVVLDLRPGSPTRGEWQGLELTPEDSLLYVPAGCANGFQTLEDEVELFYMVTSFYTPELERGVRYDDPRFGIEWPEPVTVISEKDRAWPDYEPEPAMQAVAWRGGGSDG